MRIAVSGTHSVGKSTLIDEFLRLHPEFEHEPEPYEVMVADYGEEFSEEPCVEDFLRQLEFNLNRLDQHASSEDVIYERCPLDFLAYLNALDANVSEALVRRISEAMQQLDLIVYLPLEQEGGGEYPKLRRAMDRQLSEILSSTNLAVVEATGPTSQRLRAVENALMDIKHAAG
ncbi:MAG TPA: AAA family ATPase [Pyrinomonadaceae bacterium]|nr:AAA family ATPase [Pyrinomonadaceae bacterium]